MPWVLMDELQMTPSQIIKVLERAPLLRKMPGQDALAVVRWLQEIGLNRSQVM